MRLILVSICLVSLLSCSDGQDDKQNDAADVDTDNDGWTDAYEEQIGLDPRTPDLDSDGDGVPDDLERRLGTLESNPDSDGDGIPDGKEDPDGDGLPTWFELKIGTDPGDDGTDNGLGDGWDDQDDDGVPDYLEFSMGTDPFKKDSDGDGLDDFDESNDPDLDGTNPDTDGDGIKDGDDPVNTPAGCTDTYTSVRHVYSSCIGGTFHTLTVRYYIRSCPNKADEFLYMIEKDVDTGQPCDEPVSQPPPYSELQ